MGYPVDLRFTYLVEPFGTTKGRAFPHSGDDFARKKVSGKPLQEQPDILAAFSGTVVAAGWHAQAGNRTVIRYWFGRFGVYAHQAKLLVNAGQSVTEGQKIGLLGGTGKVTGPHLHYSQYTSEARALSGTVQYWQGVKWASVDAWAAASGLVRPIYKTAGKDSTPATNKGFLMALTEKQQDEMYVWLKGVVEGEYPRRGAVSARLDAAVEAAAAAKQAVDVLTKPINGFAPMDVLTSHAIAAVKLLREQAEKQGIRIDEKALADGVLDQLGKAIVKRS